MVERSPDAVVFQHPAWLRLLRDQYGFDVVACCIADGGELVAGLPFARVESRITGSRLVALPFSDICPPLTAPPSSDRREALAALVADQHRSTGLDVAIHAPFEEVPGARLRPEFYRHVLTLDPDVSAVAGRAKSPITRGIAKARRERLYVERRVDAAGLDAFYSLHLRTRKRQGIPIQPKRFIRRFSGLFDQALGFVLLVRHQGTAVAAAVFLTFGGVLTYKYGASDERYLDKRPNNLLLMEAIRWGCENGFHTLDFGRTDLDNDGLRRFKSAWGAEEMQLAYTHLSATPRNGVHDVLRRAMKTVIRRSPESLGRAIGEAFYRHSA